VLDLEVAPQLDRALSTVQAPGRRVVLDLLGVVSADASGRRIVLGARERAERTGGELRVLAPDDDVYTRPAPDEPWDPLDSRARQPHSRAARGGTPGGGRPLGGRPARRGD
jgi:STAS domain